jgi:hypothetical protein
MKGLSYVLATVALLGSVYANLVAKRDGTAVVGLDLHRRKLSTSMSAAIRKRSSSHGTAIMTPSSFIVGVSSSVMIQKC